MSPFKPWDFELNQIKLLNVNKFLASVMFKYPNKKGKLVTCPFSYLKNPQEIYDLLKTLIEENKKSTKE